MSSAEADVLSEYRRNKRNIRNIGNKYKNTIPDGRMLVFLAGFCLGMVFFYLTRNMLDIDGLNNILMDRERIFQLSGFEINKGGLLEYVLRTRLLQLLFLILCLFSVIGGVVIYCLVGGIGFSFGLMIFTLVYRYGVKGLLLFISFLFPQGIFYFIIFVKMLNKIYRRSTKYYYIENGIGCLGLHNIMIIIKNILIFIIIFGMGIICEVYINPEIVKKVSLLF